MLAVGRIVPSGRIDQVSATPAAPAGLIVTRAPETSPAPLGTVITLPPYPRMRVASKLQSWFGPPQSLHSCTRAPLSWRTSRTSTSRPLPAPTIRLDAALHDHC